MADGASSCYVGRFYSRIKFLCVTALLTRAVARALGAAERYVVVHAGGRQVHHHHPRARCFLEIVRVFEGRRHDARGQAEVGVVGDLDRFVVLLDAHHGRDRSENLLAIDSHLVVGVDEKGRAQVEAFGVAGDPLAAAGETRTFFLADLDVGKILVELGLVDDRADVGVIGDGITYSQRFQFLDDAVEAEFGLGVPSPE